MCAKDFCECGCGQRTKMITSRFLRGHNRRGRKLSPEHKERIATATRGPNNPRWGNGQKRSRKGYILMWLPDDHQFAEMRDVKGYALEHRLVVAESLGRPLLPEEVVHHRNEIHDDNRIENLELFENNAEHTRHHHEFYTSYERR